MARDEAEVFECIRLKSFDYRAMNLLLYRLRGVEPDVKHLEFLRTSELLVEVGDDLVDFYEDVERNSFNCYRCFLALYGRQAGERLRSFIREAEGSYREQLKALRERDPPLAERWLLQARKAKRHISGSEAPEGATWEIPVA